MNGDGLAYLLLLADVLVVSALLTALLFLVVRLVSLVRRGGRRRPADGDPTASGTTWRRCDDCKLRWEAVPGRETSRAGLRVRRFVRRRARKRQRRVGWARPQGWSRCPSCLSRHVRDSRRQVPSERRQPS